MPPRGPRAERAIQLRQAILKAVLEIVHREGWHSLTIRKIADQIQYSPPMIYEHFESKEAIYAELSADGYQLLYRYMITGAAGLADPERRLRALLRSLRLFAWENPGHYQAMFGLATAGARDTRTDDVHSGACRGLLGDALFQCMNAGLLRQVPPLEAAAALMASAHGVIALRLSGQIADQRTADQLYETVTDGLIAGWKR
ncbi:MAG TPA: TetR/AcrR family transcriptional regulator [Symbiobacteriaceae bacterium]|nr:TetR/AcrR family transcriptional regulator [Symbiobacteriaceae bacterium]